MNLSPRATFLRTRNPIPPSPKTAKLPRLVVEFIYLCITSTRQDTPLDLIKNYLGWDDGEGLTKQV